MELIRPHGFDLALALPLRSLSLHKIRKLHASSPPFDQCFKQGISSYLQSGTNARASLRATRDCDEVKPFGADLILIEASWSVFASSARERC